MINESPKAQQRLMPRLQNPIIQFILITHVYFLRVEQIAIRTLKLYYLPGHPKGEAIEPDNRMRRDITKRILDALVISRIIRMHNLMI
jgi:hypothetical protein